jgi:hypothetical protein
MRLKLVAFAALLWAIPASAQQPPAKAGGAEIVPSTSFAFVTARVSDLRTVEALKPIREAIAKIEKMEGDITSQLGVSIDEMERLTLFWPSGPGLDSPIFVIQTREPYNEAKVLKTLKAMPAREMHRHGFGKEFGPRRHPALDVPAIKTAPETIPAPPKPPAIDLTPPKKFDKDGIQSQVKDPEREPPAKVPAKPDADRESSDGPELFFREHHVYSAIYLIDDRTILLLPDSPGGMIGLVGQLLARKANGPLAEAIALSSKHTIVAGMRVQALEAMMAMRGEMPRELVPYRSLFKARTVVVTADVGAKTSVSAKLTFADDAAARRAEPVLKTLVQHGIELLGDLRKKAGQEKEAAAVMLPIIDLATAALEKADVKAEGSSVTARTEAEIGPAVTKALAALPELIDVSATKMKTQNNLKQIGLAVHNFHDTMQHMPMDIVSPDGKPLMSWRVAILPYIEQDNMYRSLDMTKAWDDPVNAKVLAQMPSVFQVFGRDAGKGKTFFQMPSSPKAIPGGSPWLVPGRKLSFAHISDGTSNTIMVLEGADAVNWAKPDDMQFDPKQAPKVGDQSRKWFYALFGDGSVRTIRKDNLTDDALKALITIDGGEVVSIPD